MARSLVRPLDVLVEREDSDASDHAVLTSKTRSSLETDGEGLDRRCIRLARRTRSHGARVNTATDKHPDRDVTAEPPYAGGAFIRCTTARESPPKPAVTNPVMPHISRSASRASEGLDVCRRQAPRLPARCTCTFRQRRRALSLPLVANQQE